MGIKGLLQFLKDQQQIVNVKSYRGCTAAVDVYCWLHKAVYGCVEQIAIAGNDQGQYIAYCEKYWNVLKSNGIKPILVFDGQNLPAKAHTEKERRERRKANRDKATALLAEGKKSEARTYFERCIDITPHMAHKVIVAAVSQGIDCIIAPYEADAQLAYLSQAGIAQLIISEDSDLLCFGCERVMFKMDLNGNGVVQELSGVLAHKSFRKRFTFDSFVKMCIMSGCDYLPSLPGIGLAKATKFMSQNCNSSDIGSMLRRLPLSIKLPSGAVTDEYISSFSTAIMTFKHQVVFDPKTRKRRPLNTKTDTCCGSQDHPEDMSFAGKYLPAQQSLQIALGNINLHNMETLLPEIDPDLLLTRENGKLSIWHPEYKPKGKWNKEDFRHIDRGDHSTKDKSVLIPTERIVRKRRLSQTEAQEIFDGLCSDNATASQTAADDVKSRHDTTSGYSFPGDGFSSVEVTPKQRKTDQVDECVIVGDLEHVDEEFNQLMEGQSAPPKLTTGEKANRFMKDRMRNIYHTGDGGSQATPPVKSRYFGATSTPVCSIPSEPEQVGHCESLSGVQSECRSPSQIRSQEESGSCPPSPISQCPPSQTSSSGSVEGGSPSKYKAKFLGALDQLDKEPSPQGRAFRWSKSSLHNTDSGLTSSPNLSQQFKSPLLKSRLAQLTAEQNSASPKNRDVGTNEMSSLKKPVSSREYEAPEEGGGNPFKKFDSDVENLLGVGTSNPFRKSTSGSISPDQRGRSVLGGAAVKTEEKPSNQERDAFSNDTLRRIGQSSNDDKKSFITRKLTAFQMRKSPHIGARSTGDAKGVWDTTVSGANCDDTVNGRGRGSPPDTSSSKSKKRSTSDLAKLSSKTSRTDSDSDCEFLESHELVAETSNDKTKPKPKVLILPKKTNPTIESPVPDSTPGDSAEAADISQVTHNDLSKVLYEYSRTSTVPVAENSCATPKSLISEPVDKFRKESKTTGDARRRPKAAEETPAKCGNENIAKKSSVSAFLAQFAHKKSTKLITVKDRNPLSTSPTANAQMVDLT